MDSDPRIDHEAVVDYIRRCVRAHRWHLKGWKYGLSPDDVVSIVYLKVAKHLNPAKNFKPLVATAVRNFVIDETRRNKSSANFNPVSIDAMHDEKHDTRMWVWREVNENNLGRMPNTPSPEEEALTNIMLNDLYARLKPEDQLTLTRMLQGERRVDQMRQHQQHRSTVARSMKRVREAARRVGFAG